MLVKEGVTPRCMSVVGFEDERDRQAVADMGLRGMTILRILTVNGVPWQEVHFSIYVGMPGNIKLVEWDSLEAAVLVALMSARWKLPVPQDALLSAQLGFYMMPAAGCDLVKVGCDKEKVKLAKSDTSFRLLLTPNDIEWERHRRVQTLGEVAETLWPGVELGNLYPFVWDMTRFGVMRPNLEEEGALVGEAFPVQVVISTRPSLVTGFSPTIKHHAVEALMRAPKSSLAALLKAPPGEVSVSVNGEAELVFDSEHVTGAILAMLNALSVNVMLKDDIVMLLEFDPRGIVRQKVQSPAFKVGLRPCSGETRGSRRCWWTWRRRMEWARSFGRSFRKWSLWAFLLWRLSKSRSRRMNVCVSNS